MCDVGVQCLDIHGYARVLLLDVGGDGDVVAVLGEDFVVHQLGEVGGVLAREERVINLVPVLLGQLVLVAGAGELGGGVDKKGLVVKLALFNDDDAGGDGGAKKRRLGGGWMTA